MSAVDRLCVSFLAIMSVGFFGWLTCVIIMAVRKKTEISEELDVWATIFGILCIASLIALFIAVLISK